MTLTDRIRRMTGATTTDADDAAIAEALAENRVWQPELAIVWAGELDGTGMRVYKHGRVDAWGVLEPATSSAPGGTVLTNTLGVAPSGAWTLNADGVVTFTVDQHAWVLLVSAYGYDLYSTAADILEGMMAPRVADYDVTLGDQQLRRSQAPTQLKDLASSYRRRALARSVPVVRSDESFTQPQRGVRRRGRGRWSC